ncbi:cytochrome P450 hydroxylase [Streptomyces clavuligerus]|nr:cytochrome P450 hydroxylase [Streptomyces clavuligerus]
MPPPALNQRCPFGPSPGLTALRDEQPLRPMRYPDGHVGWLATGHPAVRKILADPRFSSRLELMHLPFELDFDGIPSAPAGDLTAMDAPEHTRYRRRLAGAFTVRRMRLLTERVEEITAEHLDAMERQGTSADLVTAFAQPVPTLVICELLGVPYTDRSRFQGYTAALSGVDVTLEEQIAAMADLSSYIQELITAKRTAPTDDLLSDLVTDGGFTDAELAGIGSFLLAAGLDTTANMIAYGTFALLSHPEQLARLRAEPELAAPAVEELLRYLSIAHTGIRTALEDVEIDGHTIRAGDTVTLSIEAANRDAERFPDPDTLDLGRRTTGHLAFGHGIHQCLGQQLARVELTVALPALLARFPGLRLAVPADEVPLREGVNVLGGVHGLPVAW